MNNKPWRTFVLRLYQHLDGILTKIYRKFCRNTEWLHFNISCNGSSTKMLIQPLKQCKIGSVLSSEKFVMLKLGCTLPNLTNICPHKWTNGNLYPIRQSDRDFCEKIGEVMTGGPWVVFTLKAVVDEAFINKT